MTLKTLLLASIAGMLPFAATAQEVAANDASLDLEEIVVTAQKRTERISDVPITITAYTGKTLRDLGITQFDQLSAFVPGLNVQEQSPNNPGFVIRGITSDSGSAQGAPAVTIYLNGVDVSRSRGSYFDLYDLERIEVVKGPQATLFGTAAAIGAVSVITARPQQELGGELRLGYGNFNQYRADGFITGGNETLQGRLAFAFKKRDGIVENIAGDPGSQTPNGPKRDDLNGQEQYGARASLRFTKGDVVVDLIGTYDGQRAPGTAFKSGTFAPTGGNTSAYTFAEASGSPFSKEILGADDLGLTRNVYDGNLTVRWTPDGPFSFTQILGYRKFDSNEVFDADGTQAFYLEFAEDAIGEQVSSETRINYDSEKLRGFVGFTYFHEIGSQRVPFSSEEGTFLQCAANIIPGLGCINAAGVVTAARATALATGGRFTSLPYTSTFKNAARIDTFSAFADATYIPTPKLELTLGARLLIERRNSFFEASAPRAVLTGAPLIPGQVDTAGQTFAAEGDFQAFLPRANLLFKATRGVNFYLTASRGRRSPVVQLGALATPAGPVANRTDVGREQVSNYEGGIKLALGRITGSLGYYKQKYDGFQVSLVTPGLPAQTVSAGTATVDGIEGEVAVQVSDILSFFANGAWIDAKVDENPAFPTFSGDRFRLQSKYQAAVGGTLTVPVTEKVAVFATPTMTYRSNLFFELPNNPLTFQPAVTLVNLRAGVESRDGKWQLLGFATNLLDREYLIDGGNTGGAFGIPTYIRGTPRLYGVEAVFRF
ncbi:TonB-dependent receptor [Glacieibacterium frigidum]|uniref:TonB-dependent receptor n=1 Tax=Glacieibacterium frigidum TaxID=2593303 RepID=A0A552U9Z7_9SPHN|nr:TonB-dependent receptor [Glacieibacterium frigidum]TRW15037.1 TonB-dependent receptor [Glacieibacterium frigidum]